MKLKITANITRTSGWWAIDGNGVCGDSVADLVDNYLDENITTSRAKLLELLNKSSVLGIAVAEAWQKDWERNPTPKELEALADFCMHLGDPDEVDD